MVSFDRLENENDEQLIYRICANKNEIGTWDDVARILNQITGNNYGESAYRKKYSSHINPNKESVKKSNSTFEQIRELERKKIEYRDERTAWQKQNYSAARIDETLAILEENLSNFGRIHFKNRDFEPVSSYNKELLICLSDLHIGETFDNCFGHFDCETAQHRLEQYLSKVEEVASTHNIKRANILCLGDLISGNIHKTIQVSNKENVIEQIKIASELISSFCYECCQIFDYVGFYNVSGNHSRIDKKEDAIHDERLDDLIGWITSVALRNVENFKYMKHRSLDVGIVDIPVCGKTYIGVHGDYDGMNKSGVSNLSMMLGFVPDVILRGHMHYPAMNEINGVKVVQAGSLAGAGDDYTLEHRMIGKPSQTMLVCDTSGIDCIYNVELK